MRLSAGTSSRLGASWDGRGTNFALFSANAQKVELCLFDSQGRRELERIDPRAAEVVELRFFGGYSDQEIGEALGVSVPTIRRDWEFARSWLFDRMHPKP